MLALVPFTFILLRVWRTLRWIFVLYIDTGKSQAWWNTALFYLQVGFMCQSRQKPAFDSFFLKWYKSYHILYKNHLYKQYDLTRKSGQVWWLSLTTIRSLIFFLAASIISIASKWNNPQHFCTCSLSTVIGAFRSVFCYSLTVAY